MVLLHSFLLDVSSFFCLSLISLSFYHQCAYFIRTFPYSRTIAPFVFTVLPLPFTLRTLSYTYIKTLCCSCSTVNLVALTSKPSAQFLLVCRIKPFDTPRLRDRIRHINSENSGQLEKLLASSLHSIAVLSTPSLQAAIKIRAKIRFGQNSASNIYIILGKRSGF